MIIELLIALTLGILAGTFTGLSPGIHINLISAILTSSLISVSILPQILIVFLVSMSITHTFLDFIPSIFLGAPEEDSFLSILPGHLLLKQGLGHQAVLLTLYGSLIALVIIIPFIPIFLFILPAIFKAMSSFIPFILIFASIYLVLRENKIFISGMIFLLSGLLGLLSLNLPINQPLLPLLSGLFGSSALLISIKNKTKIPKQILSPTTSMFLPLSQTLKTSLAAAITAPISSFLPGMGSGQAAFLASEITETNPKSFLFLVGSINTIVMALSFLTLYSIHKTRTGTAAAILNITNSISASQLIIIIVTIFVSGILAFFLGIQLSKIFANNITK